MKKRLNDLERIKYFEKVSETAVKITKEKGEINCQITFNALSIKCFDALPKD